VVVANEGAARLDLVTLGARVAGVIPLKADPHDVAVSPDGKLSWVTLDGTDDIAVVSLRRRKVIRYFSTGERPHDLLFTPDGRRVWVTDWVDGIHVFSRRGNLLRTIPRGVEPHHLAFSPDGRQVWITDHGVNRVLILIGHTTPGDRHETHRRSAAPHHDRAGRRASRGGQPRSRDPRRIRRRQPTKIGGHPCGSGTPRGMGCA
jgi:DNA-binding beta-propeller fold protein YncE